MPDAFDSHNSSDSPMLFRSFQVVAECRIIKIEQPRASTNLHTYLDMTLAGRGLMFHAAETSLVEGPEMTCEWYSPVPLRHKN